MLRPHQDGSLARGTYRTLVNIHNPTDRKITFADKVALAEPVGATPGSFLDVVSVYTARPTEGEVKTLEVETVQPRKLREMVKVLPIEAKPEVKKHIEYPPRKNPGYGTGESKGK